MMERILLIAGTIKQQVSNSSTSTGATSDVQSAINFALQVVFGVVAVIALVAIIFGGVTYTMSRGDPGKVKKGKDAIIYGIIGLVVSLLAFAIVTFVLGSI